MRSLVVVENPDKWPLSLSGATVMDARSYLSGKGYAGRRCTVYNLCRSFRYQTIGYYVSLLAAARGHRPLPSVETLGDLRLWPVLRLVSEELEPLFQKTFSNGQSEEELRIYLGRHPDREKKALSSALFHHFPIPLLRARFRKRDGEWSITSVSPLATGDVPETERQFLAGQLEGFFSHPRRPAKKKENPLYSIAILVNPEEKEPPSDEKAIQKLIKAARELQMEAVLIEPSDYPHLAEFDALFIRETTRVNHHTYRFARRAEAEGLVVLDDPESILRCCNKAYQAELFERYQVPCPKTVLADRTTNLDSLEALGFPLVVKVPDSSFCNGVSRVADRGELKEALETIFEDSELAVVQAFTPSGFDWRIGVLDRRPLFACRYAMAPGHWQIYKELPSGEKKAGRVQTFPVDEVPEAVVQTALKAANLIGDGLYGVDLKEIEGGPLVIEINDNPSLESGDEDRYLKQELYLTIMRSFFERLERKRREVKHDSVAF